MGSTRRATSATSMPPHPNTPKTPFSTPKPISASVNSVLLDDWWLVRTQGNALAVEGFALSLRRAIRTFSSAAISKRHTATTLETTDGIIVTLTGLLNIPRTTRNGFPPEVCNSYLLGFPFDWEEHAAGLWGQGSTDESASFRNSSSQKFNMSLEDSESNPLPFSIDDVPVTDTRDFILSCVGDSEKMKTIFDGILRDNVFQDTTRQINSDMEDTQPIESENSQRIEMPTMAHIDDDKNKSADICSKGSQNTKRRRNNTGTNSVPTRWSSRLKNLK